MRRRCSLDMTKKILYTLGATEESIARNKCNKKRYQTRGNDSNNCTVDYLSQREDVDTDGGKIETEFKKEDISFSFFRRSISLSCDVIF